MLLVANIYENRHQRAAVNSIGKHGLCTAVLAVAEEYVCNKQEGKKDRKTFNHYNNV
jgi:hypothetical protein